MMQTLWKNLYPQLAQLYPTDKDARRVVRTAGFDPVRFDFGGDALTMWSCVLEQAERDAGSWAAACDQLLSVVTTEHPQVGLRKHSSGLESLKDSCRLNSQQEIDRFVARKYIPDLFVPREQIDIATLDDEAIVFRISQLMERLEPNLRRVIALYEGLMVALGAELTNARLLESALGRDGTLKGSGSTGANKESRVSGQLTIAADFVSELKRCWDEILARTNAILNDRHPFDAASRAVVHELSLRCREMMGCLDEDQLKTRGLMILTENRGDPKKSSSPMSLAFRNVYSLAEVYQQVLAPHVVIIDKAGSGKTNLFANLAVNSTRFVPCLFFTARAHDSGLGSVRSADDLLLTILSRAGLKTSGAIETDLDALTRLLRPVGGFLTVFIDGLNEYRDLMGLSRILDALLPRIAGHRVRLVISCRDIYWPFVAQGKWTTSFAPPISGKLAEFSLHERQLAIDVYLRHFKIRVDLGDPAKDMCRRPIMLRFFCEAYGSADADFVSLGHCEDLRLKRIFDDYWTRKLRDVDDGGASERLVMLLADTMLSKKTTSLPLSTVRRKDELLDVDSAESPYIRILGEDVILDETPPTAKRNHGRSKPMSRRVEFVYDEFMEYAMARAYYMRKLRSSEKPGLSDAIVAAITELAGVQDKFVNVLGICEYLIGDLLVAGYSDAACRGIETLLTLTAPWQAIVVNLFQKYDETLDMVGLVLRERGTDGLHVVRHVLRVLVEKGAPSVCADVCLVLAQFVFLPEMVSFGECYAIDTKRMSIPDLSGRHPTEELFSEDRAFALTAAKCISEMEGAARGGDRTDWRGLLGKLDNDVDGAVRLDILQKLVAACAGSPRRRVLLLHMANGYASRVGELRKRAPRVELIGHTLTAAICRTLAAREEARRSRG